LLTKWDTEIDARQFSDAFGIYGKDRWGNPVDQSGILHWEANGQLNDFKSSGSQTLWVSAPDDATAQTILNLVPLQ
jgi:hypothetical protein